MPVCVPACLQGFNPPGTPAGPLAGSQAVPNALGTCGLRIMESQTDLRCLAHQLNITLELSDFDTLIRYA